MPQTNPAAAQPIAAVKQMRADMVSRGSEILYDTLYRELGAVQGRWIQPDPSGLAAAEATTRAARQNYKSAWPSPAARRVTSHPRRRGLRNRKAALDPVPDDVIENSPGPKHDPVRGEDEWQTWIRRP